MTVYLLSEACFLCGFMFCMCWLVCLAPHVVPNEVSR